MDGLVNNPASPRVQYQPVNVQLGVAVNTIPLQRQFAYAVIKQQPMRVTGDIARDSIKIFALTRNTVEGDTPIKRWQFQNTYPVYPPGITAQRPEQRHQPVRRGRGRRESAGPAVRRRRAAGLPAARRVHAGTGVPARAAGRDRRDLHLPQARSGEPLPWPACWSPGSAVAVLLGADLYEFSWRYQLPALVTLPIAGALGATAIARQLRRRRADKAARPAPAEELATAESGQAR